MKYVKSNQWLLLWVGVAIENFFNKLHLRIFVHKFVPKTFVIYFLTKNMHLPIPVGFFTSQCRTKCKSPVQPEEEKDQGDLISKYKFLQRESAKRMKPASAQWWPVAGPEAMATSRNTLFHCDGEQTPAQIAQRGCRVSFLGNMQKPSGHGPGQPVPGGHLKQQGWHQKTVRGPFQSEQCDFCDK